MPEVPQKPLQWESLKELLADVLELLPDEREAFLYAACKGDEPLRLEVQSLITAHENSDGVIDRRTDAWLGLGGPDLLSLGGQRIGRYTLDRLVAEGAMAAVYVARQMNPNRVVALKLVRFNMPMVDVATRFKRESDALGRLQHPNIARIYEAGVHRTPGHTQSAMPFIAMEYVDGPPLNVYAQQQKLTRAQRVRLMIKVASAVHAAHQQAVIHRDLKPANVLVDSTGEPKVLDFGIARIVGVEEDKNTWQTTAGVLLGTPGYMSPEQASGRLDLVDIRTDVWSLGVLLHELLTDRLPIEVKNYSTAEILQRIARFEPQPIGRIDRSLKGDLETIVMTALDHDKEQRYASAQALADDLRRVLEYEPISARAHSRWYRAKKFVRRNRAGFVVSMIFALLLMSAAVVSSIGFVRASRERDRTRTINRFLQDIISTADPNVGAKDVTVIDALGKAEGAIRDSFAGDPTTEAEVRSKLAWTYFNLGRYDRAHEQITRAIALRTATLGPSDALTIDDNTRLATILRWQYRPEEAKQVATKAYALASAKLGPEHASTLSLLDPLAGAAHDMGDLVTARREYERAVELHRKLFGDTNAETLTLMNNLAVVYTDAGEYAMSEAILRKLIDIRAARTPVEALSLTSLRINLAVSLSEQGRVAEAEKMLAALSAEAARTLGRDHDTTISVIGNHAEMLRRLGRTDEAQAALKDAMDRSIASYGLSHDMSLGYVADYATSLTRAKRFDEARELATRALDAAVILHGNDHNTVLVIRQSLAGALAGLGMHAEAESMYREVIAAFTQRFGEEHSRPLTARCNLAFSMIDQSRGADAAAILEPVLAIVQARKMRGLEPNIRRNLGRAFVLEKKYELAQEQLLAAHRLSESQHDARSAAEIAGLLASLYEKWSRPEDAARWHTLAK